MENKKIDLEYSDISPIEAIAKFPNGDLLVSKIIDNKKGEFYLLSIEKNDVIQKSNFQTYCDRKFLYPLGQNYFINHYQYLLSFYVDITDINSHKSLDYSSLNQEINSLDILSENKFAFLLKPSDNENKLFIYSFDGKKLKCLDKKPFKSPILGEKVMKINSNQLVIYGYDCVIIYDFNQFQIVKIYDFYMDPNAVYLDNNICIYEILGKVDFGKEKFSYCYDIKEEYENRKFYYFDNVIIYSNGEIIKVLDYNKLKFINEENLVEKIKNESFLSKIFS